MVLVKILGTIDLVSSFVFLMLAFNMHPYFQVTLFCAGLLFLKGLFVFTGDVLSIIDLISSIVLIISIFFILPQSLIWILAFILLGKAFVSFI